MSLAETVVREPGSGAHHLGVYNCICECARGRRTRLCVRSGGIGACCCLQSGHQRQPRGSSLPHAAVHQQPWPARNHDGWNVAISRAGTSSRRHVAGSLCEQSSAACGAALGLGRPSISSSNSRVETREPERRVRPRGRRWWHHGLIFTCYNQSTVVPSNDPRPAFHLTLCDNF